MKRGFRLKSGLKCGLLILLLPILLLSSCNSSSSHGGASKNRLKICLNRDPVTLDPRKGGDVVSSSMHFLLFDGLTRLNESGKQTLSGASHVDISMDRKTYTFYLKDAKWSNGNPITAHDYEYSWKKTLHPSFPAPNAHLLYPIKNALKCKKGYVTEDKVGVQAVSDHVLKVELEKPTPYFLDLVAFCVFFPVSKDIDIKHPDWCYGNQNQFVSNGPFILEEWKHHNSIALKKTKQYWDAQNTKLDGIDLSMVQSETTALGLFEKGELDIISTSVSSLPTEAIENLKRKGILHINQTAGSKYCCFNNSKKPFSNKHIRKAFALAINRSKLVDNITLLGEQIATGAVPPALKSGRSRHFFKDGDHARAVDELELGLNELGLKRSDLDDLVYSYSSSESDRRIAQALQQQWATVLGVHIKLQSMDHKVLLDRLKKRNYDLADAMWMAQYFDQISILERFAYPDNPKNYASWQNSHYLQLLHRSFGESTAEKRLCALEEAEEIFISDMPVAPLYHINYAYLINPRVESVIFNPMGFLIYEKTSLKND